MNAGFVIYDPATGLIKAAYQCFVADQAAAEEVMAANTPRGLKCLVASADSPALARNAKWRVRDGQLVQVE